MLRVTGTPSGHASFDGSARRPAAGPAMPSTRTPAVERLVRMTRRLFALVPRLLAPLALPFVAACAVAQPQAPAFPVGATFAWIGTNDGATRRIDVPDPNRYTIRFDASGRAELRLDCNRGSAQWSRDGGRLTLSPPASTKMKCADGSLDSAFAAGLARAARWHVESDVLVLSGDDGSAMRFATVGR